MTSDRQALLTALLADLAAESADLDGVVSPLSEQQWHLPTPADGWDVLDTVNHLRVTDRDAVLAAEDPAGFGSHLEQVVRPVAATYIDGLVEDSRDLAPAQVLAGWREGRERFAQVLASVDPTTRIPWFGPAMSPASFVTARVMETWAHGQDVADTLGVQRVPTDRLRAVAEIGVRARPFAFAARGLPAPTAPVRVLLDAPSGARWEWGPAGAADEVTGPALDFCLLVTQRRHRDDLQLRVQGAAAAQWVTIAQAFAGVPGAGRQPRR